MLLAKRLAFFRFDFSFGIIKGEQPLIRCGVGGVQRKGGGSRNTPPYLWPSGASCTLRRKHSTLPSAMNKFKRQRQKVETFSPIGPFHCTRWQNVLK